MNTQTFYSKTLWRSFLNGKKTQPYRMKEPQVDIFKGITLKVFFTVSKFCEKVQCSYYFI